MSWRHAVNLARRSSKIHPDVLLSLVLELEPRDKLQNPTSLGRASHAGFLGFISRIDPSQGKRLHSAEVKPFTLAILPAPHPGKKGRNRLCQGTIHLRLTSLERDLSTFLWSLEPADIGTIRLLSTECEVIQVVKCSNDPWAGQSSFAELHNNGLVKARESVNLIGLDFLSPVAFRMAESRLSMPLPWPRLVFQSLAARWNAFSPIPLEIDWPAFDRQISVARHRLETRMLDFGRYRQVGFVGECWYLIDRKAGFRLLQALHTLADFAFYAGVGAKTTMGMGLVRRIDKEGG